MSVCSCLVGGGVGGKERGGGESRARGGPGNTARPQEDEGVINKLGMSAREVFC